LQFKPEQRNAVEYLLNHDDVLAFLPTGYGKSLIFQLFAAAAAASIERKEPQTVGCLPLEKNHRGPNC